MDECIQCGHTYEQTSNSQQFCSTTCRRAFHKPTPKARTIPEGRTCRYRDCGKSIVRKPAKSGPLSEFCNKTCRRRERSARDADNGVSYQPKSERKARRRKHQIGDAFGDLTLIDYRPSDRKGSRAVFRCSCGAGKELAVGNVTSGATINCADRSVHPDPRRAELPAINSAHARVKHLRGPARALPCAMCGHVGAGNDWSYRHSSLDPLVQDSGKDSGQVYSTDPADYWVLCRRHHNAFDKGYRRLGVPVGQVSGFHHIFALAYDPYGDVEHAACLPEPLSEAI